MLWSMAWKNEIYWDPFVSSYMLQDENNFWKDLQKKYLEPLKESKEQQDKIANDLRELRNKVIKKILCHAITSGAIEIRWILRFVGKTSVIYFPTGGICFFLLQCTLVSGYIFPSSYWWLCLHKDSKGLSQWELFYDRNVFSWSDCADVSSKLCIAANNAVFCNALPQVKNQIPNEYFYKQKHLKVYYCSTRC